MPVTQYYNGTATAVVQVTQKNVASSTNGHTFIITLAYEDGTTAAVLTHTVDGVDAGNTTTIAAEIVTEFNALTHALATPITASNSTSKVIFTADTAGIPFTATYSGTGTWDNTGVTNVASAGPSDWNIATNWSGGTVPVTGDSVVLDYRQAAAITYGLYQAGVTLAAFYDYNSRRYAVGTTTYPLKVPATIAQFGLAASDGNVGSSAFMNWHGHTVATTITVYGSAQQGTGGLAPLMIGANEATNVLNVLSGIVWVSKLTPSEAGTFATINISGGIVTIGRTAAFTNLNVTGGTVTAEQTASGNVVTVGAGALTLNGTAIVTTVNCNGGTTYINNRVSGADITTLAMNGGVADFTQNLSAFTASTLAIKRGGTIRLGSASQATWTAVTLDASDPVNLQVSAAA